MKKRVCWILIAISCAVMGCHRDPESIVDPSSGERKYAIKLSRPSKKGDRFHVSARGTRTITKVVSGQGKMLRSTNDALIEMEGEIEVLETDPERRISKMSCTIENCTITTNGVPHSLTTNRA